MRYFPVLLSLCAAAVAHASVSEASIEQTQQYLKDWDLHESFGDAFRSLRYDGRFLESLDESDFDQALFPSATRAHWKVLLKEIRRTQQRAPRRLASAIDTKDWKGVRIKTEKAVVTFGAKEDVQLIRTGPRQLAVTAGIKADSLDVKKLTVGGKDVGGGDFAKMFAGINDRLDNMTQMLRDGCGGGGSGGGGKLPPKDCKDILKKDPTASSGIYKVQYKGNSISVMCDMKTAGGGWTLILRDSWKDKTVKAYGGSPLPAENSVGKAGATQDYVGPHYMGSVTGTNPLQTNALYMYKIDACTSGDCAMISDQEFSFHAKAEKTVDGGFHSSPIRTVSGKTVHADKTDNNRLNYFYMYPSSGCGLSTDRDNGGNCWNNMFASNRWENLPAGKSSCVLQSGCKSSGDANSFWVRERDPVDPTATSCYAIKQKHKGSTDGLYTIFYLGQRLKVKCDMTTKGGGWTLILRDSWKQKAVMWNGKSAMQKENSYGVPDGYDDYVGPHYMGSKKGTNPLKTNVDYMYTGSGCDSADCKFISRQEYSFHAIAESTVDGGFHSSPLKTLSGKTVQADKTSSNRLNYLYLYPAGACGLSTDRDNGGNCWNNMFATHRWENMPGGTASCHYHAGGSSACIPKFGDANMLWVRPR